MVALSNQERHIVDLFRALPPQRRPYVMLVMAGADPDAWKRFQSQGERRLRELAAQRGIDWDALTDDQRQDFVGELLDEGRP